MLEEDVTVSALSVAQDFEKLLREVSCSWALLVALSYQNRGLGEDAPAGARQQKRYCRSPVQKTLHPAGLWETGRKIASSSVLPVSSTGITSYQTSQVKYLHSPPPLIIEQAKKNLRNSKYLDLRRTKCWWPAQFFITCMFCKYFSQAVACLFIFLSVSFEKPAFLIWSGSNVSIFSFAIHEFFYSKKYLHNPKSKIFPCVFFLEVIVFGLWSISNFLYVHF